jgi:UDP-glucose 4-epimerase
MRCIVTGGAGFIGSHVVDRLIADGHDVCVIDTFVTGRPENLARHRGSGRLALERFDVADYAAIAPLFQGADWVFHLAGLADIVPSIERPLDYHHANVDGTVAVLEAARRARVRRFVYAASSSCYGLPEQFPTPETAPARPQYPYALSKYVAEEHVLFWGRLYDMPVVSLRLFNVYGPRARTTGAYGAVFGVFLAQKLAGVPFTLVGDGSQKRDFTFVTDVVEAFVAAARSDLVGEVLNVGTGQPQSVRRLVELLGGPVVRIPKRPGEPDCTHADVAKIKSRLGWLPKVSFEEGVAAMLEDIEAWRGAPVWTPATIEQATRDWFAHLAPRATSNKGARA